MSKLYSALLPCEKRSKTVVLIGQSFVSEFQRGGEGDLLVIVKPCLLPRIQG